MILRYVCMRKPIRCSFFNSKWRLKPEVLTKHSIEEKLYYIEGPFRPQKHGKRRWNILSLSFTSWDIGISGLAAAILDLRLPLTPDNIETNFIEFPVSKNMGRPYSRFSIRHLEFPTDIDVAHWRLLRHPVPQCQANDNKGITLVLYFWWLFMMY